MTADSREELISKVVAQVEGLRGSRVQAICSHPLHRDLSLPQLHILIRLTESGPMMVSEAAGLFGISAPSASSILDRMEERGLVDRTRDKDDRRVVRVAATARGRATAEEFVGLKRDEMVRLLDAMTDAELEDVNRGMAAVQRALSAIGASPSTRLKAS